MKIRFYCLAIEAGFYSDMVEYLPVDPANFARVPAGTGTLVSLYDIYMMQSNDIILQLWCV